jgi:hypothetical protein
MRVRIVNSFKESVTKMTKRDGSRIISFAIVSLVVVLNSVIIKSPYIGIPVSLIFLYISAVSVGKLFYFNEKPFLKEALGLATFVVMMALSGAFLILAQIFTETLSLITVVAISLIFHIISMRRRTGDNQRVFDQSKRSKITAIESYLLLCSCLLMMGIAFYALIVARTTEGVTSVWLTIPNFFLPVFLFSSLLLLFTLFFTRLSVDLKLSLILLYSFLVHSLFLLVWYPGRYGDPWTHLGRARFIDQFGAPYAYDWLLKNLYIKDIIIGKTQYALVAIFRRFLSVDIYWVHIAFIPLVWALFTPLFSYKIAELLLTNSIRETRTIVDKNKIVPLIAAIATVLFPKLVYWGTISVPNSFGFFFLFLSIVFLLYWTKTRRKRMWFLSLLACIVTLLAHPQPGIFALMFLLLVTVIQKSSNSVLKIACYPLMFISYPLVLRSVNATFTIEGLLSLENLLTFQSDIATVLFAFGILGLVLGITGRYVDRRKAVILFVLYLTIIVEYYVTMYGMEYIPYGPGRILAMADFLMVPFVALGIWGVVDVLGKAFSRLRTFSLSLPKTKLRGNPHFLSLFIVSLLLSSQIMFTLYEAYPRDEIQDVQPAAYEIDAIHYIVSDANGWFAVLCEPGFASLASGFLGSEYAYGAGPKGVFGIPEWSFWTAQLYLQMCKVPSVSIMRDAMSMSRATVSYFVVSVRNPNFEEVVQQTSEILPVDKVFGDGKLYVFKEIRPELVEGIGPTVRVIFDDGVSADYVQTGFKFFYETDVSYTVSLSGHSSYNLTNYPNHWTFQSLVVDGLAARFDESSNVNTFVYVSELRPDNVLEVTWHANDVYPVVVWKEDAFKSGWQRHPFYFIPKISPDIITDGNVLSLSWDFSTYNGEYQFYYYLKPCNITTSEDQYIIARWKSTGPVAVMIVYFDEGEQIIVPFNSQSENWIATTVKLEPGRKIENIMVGISNLRTRSVSGSHTVYIDYILICSKD